MIKITVDEIRKHIEGIYYSSENKDLHWAPFEDYDSSSVEEFIDNDILYWKGFLEAHGVEVINK